MSPLIFCAETLAGGLSTCALPVEASRLIIAGWTGRDRAAIDHHIEELKAIGVAAPSQVPLYYRASAPLLTQAARVEVLGADSSGEAEPVLFFAEGEWWLTVGSDHTDRTVETYGVAVSKQMCPKPIARSAWRWAEVAGHQDELQLHSRILENGQWVPYQAGALTRIQPLAALLAGSPIAVADSAETHGAFMFCGTLPAIANAEGKAIRPAAAMEIELFDPRLSRRIVHRYEVQTLAIVS